MRVRAASVHPDVWHVVAGQPVCSASSAPDPTPPRAGARDGRRWVVVSVGSAVSRFRAGDEVFGETVRGVQWRNGGTFAEYATAPEVGVALKPRGVSFEEAAAVPTAGLIALNNLPQRRVPPGSRVLVNGAAGGLGAIAVQLAKVYGAEVTGVDHGSRLAFVRSLGADRVIDYTSEDFTRSGEKWDLIFDVPGGPPFRAIPRRWNRQAPPPDRHDRIGATRHQWLGSIPRLLRLAAAPPSFPSCEAGPLRPRQT